MLQTTNTLRIYLDETQQGSVTCPFCQEERALAVKNAKEYLGGKTLKVKCKHCEALFPAHFDYRKHQRVNVNFNGKLLKSKKFLHDKHIVITSLSVSGIGFVMDDVNGLQNEDIIDIAFILDDQYHSTIQETVVIRRIVGNFIGAEYVRDDYCHELDFYVMRQPLFS